MTNIQIDAAVGWWASHLKEKKFSGLSKEERASGENAGYEVAEKLATVMARKETEALSDKQVKLFKTALAHLILDTLKEQGGRMYLGVDYGPDTYLAHCLKFAGIPISSTILPWKTVMWLSEERGVEVAYGYRAEAVKIA